MFWTDKFYRILITLAEWYAPFRSISRFRLCDQFSMLKRYTKTTHENNTNEIIINKWHQTILDSVCVCVLWDGEQTVQIWDRLWLSRQPVNFMCRSTMRHFKQFEQFKQSRLGFAFAEDTHTHIHIALTLRIYIHKTFVGSLFANNQYLNTNFSICWKSGWVESNYFFED